MKIARNVRCAVPCQKADAIPLGWIFPQSGNDLRDRHQETRHQTRKCRDVIPSTACADSIPRRGRQPRHQTECRKTDFQMQIRRPPKDPGQERTELSSPHSGRTADRNRPEETTACFLSCPPLPSLVHQTPVSMCSTCCRIMSEWAVVAQQTSFSRTSPDRRLSVLQRSAFPGTIDDSSR